MLISQHAKQRLIERYNIGNIELSMSQRLTELRNGIYLYKYNEVYFIGGWDHVITFITKKHAERLYKYPTQYRRNQYEN